MKTWKAMTGGLVLATLAALGPARAAQDEVVARAGDVRLTRADVAALVAALGPDAQTRLAAEPALLTRLVRARLAEQVLVNEAKSRDWDRQDRVRALVEAAQREAVFRSYLASVSAPPADYPSDAELQAAYDGNRALFATPRALHVAQIYLAVPADADAATLAKARKQAAELLRRARAPGTEFGALARASSQDTASAAQGGDLGFTDENRLVPAIRQALAALKPGEISEPVRTDTGLHLVKLIEVRPAGARPLAEVREQLRASLRAAREQQNAQAYLAKQVAPGAATLDEQALEQLAGAAQ
ncbi:peptidylprolyl isomerase [Burkholderia sp. FERM BP-3421]|uniref:peptidylprolyl isomerase n=1 Tax=Burkholderia sp. FERM BP-3421 TaxID=1494466 RepID=UPI002363056A|nr:peptidylprolyl isomerase [Burkholderia sp. FERM BP-3421]WDD91367.1 peptidylprolyl isomerase [Burkholderia sp. FERM BP-3421]